MATSTDNDARSKPSNREKIDENVGTKQNKVKSTNIVLDKPENEVDVVSTSTSGYNSSIHSDDGQSAEEQKNPPRHQDNVNAKESVNRTRHHDKPSDRQDVSVATPLTTVDHHLHEGVEHSNRTDHESKTKGQDGMVCSMYFPLCHEPLKADRHDHTDEETEKILTNSRADSASSKLLNEENVGENVDTKQNRVNSSNIVLDKDHVDKPKNEGVADHKIIPKHNSSIDSEDEQSVDEPKKAHQHEDNIELSVTTAIPSDHHRVHEGAGHANQFDQESKIKDKNGMFFVYLLRKQDPKIKTWIDPFRSTSFTSTIPGRQRRSRIRYIKSNQCIFVYFSQYLFILSSFASNQKPTHQNNHRSFNETKPHRTTITHSNCNKRG